jgi:DNA-binding NarL/FixJ family response regulator
VTGVPLKASVLLADDHALVRHGIRMVIDEHPDLHVVAEAANGAEAVEIALRTPIHLAVLDAAMPRLTGLQATRHIREQRPDVRVLIVSMHDNEQFFFEALEAGASGYVLKSAAHEDLVEACRAALRGQAFIYPPAMTTLLRRYLESGETGLPADPLTPRETEIVKLIAEGLTAKEIAETLTISEHTVQRHRANVLDKLGLRDRVALTRYAVRRGLIEV